MKTYIGQFTGIRKFRKLIIKIKFRKKLIKIQITKNKILVDIIDADNPQIQEMG
jgi:hypothetical protein